MRILLIEDDVSLCKALLIHLGSQGYETDVCHNGTDGLSYALQNTYDLIILDRMLPDMELPRIHCDKSRVIQILTILLDNAITYTLPDGMIDLEIFIKKRNVCYLVADHGNGIPDEEKERIFDRFYQSDKSRKEKEHFGLGLSIARELTELQKGKLTLTDTPGGGCTFCLMLPAAEEGNVT